MGQGDATDFRCLVLRPACESVGWLQAAVQAVVAANPGRSVTLNHVERWDEVQTALATPAGEAPPYGLVVLHRLGLAPEDQDALMQLHRMVAAQRQTGVLVIGEPVSEGLPESDCPPLPGQVGWFREPVPRAAFTQWLRMLVQWRGAEEKRLRAATPGGAMTLVGAGFGADADAAPEPHAKTAPGEPGIEDLHGRLLAVTRQAGMAEVATGVLHNVGNVLNSVTTAVSTLKDRMQQSRVSDLNETVSLLKQHEHSLEDFLSGERGAQFMAFIHALNDRLQTEQRLAREEILAVDEHVRHICQIVSMQQSYAKVLGVQERVCLRDLIDQAVLMNAAGLQRHGVELKIDSADDVDVFIERHKVLQILVNLISNAKYACDQKQEGERLVHIKTRLSGAMVAVVVSDTGVGIRPENMGKLFTHGFTTKKDGHGFGLHNSVLVAKEMGGRLTATSEGEGKGACFRLELPVPQAKEAA